MPERSAERSRLAEAIEYLAALDKQLARLAEARQRLDRRGREDALAVARRGLDEAKANAPSILVAKALGEPVDAAQTTATAEELLAAAQRSLAEAVTADRLLADEMRIVEDRCATARLARDSAVDAVVRASPEIAVLCARIEQRRQELYDYTWTISGAGGAAVLPPGHFWDGVLWGVDRGCGAVWKAARAALEQDADAELPG
jgi:hypothetical protein